MHAGLPSLHNMQDFDLNLRENSWEARAVRNLRYKGQNPIDELMSNKLDCVRMKDAHFR